MRLLAKPHANLWHFMKISVFVLTVHFTLLGPSFAKDVNGMDVLNKKIELHLKNATYQDAFTAIEGRSKVKFVYHTDIFTNSKPLSITSRRQKLKAILDRMLRPQEIKYEISNDNVIMLTKVKEPAPMEPIVLHNAYQEKKMVDSAAKLQGKVTSKGMPVIGASILIEGTSHGTSTDNNGNFQFRNIASGEYSLVISHVGFSNLRKKVSVTNQDMVLAIEMPEDPLQLQEVMITGIGSPKRKIESSVAITTVSAKSIEDRAPLNSADVIKAIPGVMVASSGGDGPGNVRVRGLPSNGGYIFFGVMEDGLPIVPTGFNSIPSADQYFKSDITIKTIEAIRGGNAPLVMVNTPGALMNNISYTGADKTYGKFKYTSGLSQDLNRMEANIGGKISSKVKYNVGGFYRTDKGIKPSTFTGTIGGQFKANLTWNFNKNGYFRIYGKYLNDKVQWYLPGIYGYNKEHRSDPYNNFDMYKQTLLPSQTQFDLKVPEGNTVHINLEDGYHTKLGYGGFLFNYTTNGWNIKNNFRYQATNILADYLLLSSVNSFSTTAKYYYTTGEQLTNPTGSYVTEQLSNQTRSERHIIDYVDITKTIGKNSLTIGGGIYSYNVRNFESINAILNTLVENQPRVILVNSPTASPITAAANSSNGGHGRNNGITSMSSIYASDEFTITDRLRVDGGIRVDHFSLSGTKGAYSGSSTSSGGSGFIISSMVPWSGDKTYWSASLAFNYKVSNSVAFFLRGTRSYNAFNISDYTVTNFNEANLRNRVIQMGELGLKYAQGLFALFSSFSYTDASNLGASIMVPNASGALVITNTFASSRSFGWETEATYQVSRHFNLRLTSTVQDPRFKVFQVTLGQDVRPDLAGMTVNWAGNSPQTTPKLSLQLGGNYDYKWFSLFGNALYNGAMWSTPAETYSLPSYTEVTAGAGAKFDHNKFELRGWVNNLLDTRALTEGNLRGEQFINEKDLVPGQAMIGRAILPRSFWLSFAYSF